MIGSIFVLGREVSAYALCAGFGFAVVCLYLPRFAEMRGIPGYCVSSIAVFCAPFVLVGASFVFGLTNYRYLFASWAAWLYGKTTIQGLFVAVINTFSGLVFYGGCAGAIAGVGIWQQLHKELSASECFDLVALAIPLFHAFGRIGCLLGGCCYGVECHPGIVLAGSPLPGVASVERFPVQLVEAIGEAVIFLYLTWLYQYGRNQGQLLWCWIMGYAPLRFTDEYVRGDVYRGFLGPLSTSQWISVLLLIIAICNLARQYRAHRLSQYR